MATNKNVKFVNFFRKLFHMPLNEVQENIGSECFYDKDELSRAYMAYKDSIDGQIDNLDSFINFLKSNNLSTAHAKEIYNYIKGNVKNLKVGDDFNLRKSHPIRDYFIKKIAIPTAITSTLTGLAAGAIAVSGSISGSTAFGILPVFSHKVLTFATTGAVGMVAGLILTPAIIITKNVLTKQYYKAKYKSAEQNLADLNADVRLENLNISKLMNKIEETSRQIFELNAKGGFIAGVKKHLLNTINRNRIHHLEHTIIDFYSMWKQTNQHLETATQSDDASAVDNFKKQKNNIAKILRHADDFITSNIKEAKLNALLSCKETGTHTHSTIENTDIYSNLVNALNCVKQGSTAKETKSIVNNLDKKRETAAKLLAGQRLVSRLINEKTTNVISTQLTADGLVISGENGETITLNPAMIDTTKEIDSIMKTSKGCYVFYEDGSEDFIPNIKKADKKETLAIERLHELLTYDAFIKDIAKKKLTFTDKDGNKVPYGTDAISISLRSKMESWLGITPKSRPKFETTDLTAEELKLYKYLFRKTYDEINKFYGPDEYAV